MKLKICTKCKAQVTTKNSQYKGRSEMGLFFNCLAIQDDGKPCHGTILVRAKNWRSLFNEKAS